MVVLGGVAGDASVAPDVGRSRANLEVPQEAVHGCRSASDHDFLSAMAEMECLFLLVYRGVRKRCQVRRPRDAWQMAVLQPVRWALSAHGLGAAQLAAQLRV